MKIKFFLIHETLENKVLGCNRQWYLFKNSFQQISCNSKQFRFEKIKVKNLWSSYKKLDLPLWPRISVSERSFTTKCIITGFLKDRKKLVKFYKSAFARCNYISLFELGKLWAHLTSKVSTKIELIEVEVMWQSFNQISEHFSSGLKIPPLEKSTFLKFTNR